VEAEMFTKLYKLYDLLSLIRWRGAVYIWRPKHEFTYVNKALLDIYLDERTKWFIEKREKYGERGLVEFVRIQHGDLTMWFKKIWMGDRNGVKKVVLIKLEG
jgi:hypothetical protein